MEDGNLLAAFWEGLVANVSSAFEAFGNFLDAPFIGVVAVLGSIFLFFSEVLGLNILDLF